MKILFMVLAAVCALWVLLALMVPFHKPDNAPVDFQRLARFGFVVTMRSRFLGLETINKPPPFEFWSAGAIKSAEDVIARSGSNILDGTPLTVSRGTLMILTLRAKQPDEREEQVQLFRWASARLHQFCFPAILSNPVGVACGLEQWLRKTVIIGSHLERQETPTGLRKLWGRGVFPQTRQRAR
jgi:hypothetical protein